MNYGAEKPNLATFAELYTTPSMSASDTNIQPDVNEGAVDNKKTAKGDYLTIAGKQINKKKAIIGGATVLAAIAGGIALYIRGKNKLNILPNEGLKGFFDKNNNLAENVKFEKGKALYTDNSPFSGIFKTTNKKGNNITIEYENGIIKKSLVEGDGGFEKLYTTSDKGEIKAVKINSGENTNEIDLEKIRAAVKEKQDAYNDLMNSNILRVIEDFDTKYLNAGQKENVDKIKQKIAQIGEQYNKDALEYSRFAFEKELEFREKIPGFQETYKSVMERFNNGEGITLEDGSKVIKDYGPDDKLLKEITLNKHDRLTVTDYQNKTRLEGRYNKSQDFFEANRWFEGYEKTDSNTLKYDRMYETPKNTLIAYFEGYFDDIDNAFKPLLEKYQEGYSLADGHTKIKKEVMLGRDVASNNNSLTMEKMKKIASGERFDGQIIPAFSEGCEILPDGTEIFKKKAQHYKNLDSYFEYYTNLKCKESAKTAPIDRKNKTTFDIFLAETYKSVQKFIDEKTKFNMMQLGNNLTLKDLLK